MRRDSPAQMRTAALLIADTAAIEMRFRGEALLGHAVRGLLESGCVARIVVMAPSGAESALSAISALSGGRCQILPAAATRAESIRLAFAAAEECDFFLVHDAARAFVPPDTIQAVAEAVVRGAEAVVPVLSVTDTVKLVGPGDVVAATEDRTQLRTLQAPFGCTADVLRETCARGGDPLSSPPGNVRTVAGHPNAIRLATPFDLVVAEALLTGTTKENGQR